MRETQPLQHFGDHGSDSRSHLKKFLLDEVLDHFMRCIWVNLQLSSQRTDGRKRLAA